MSIKRMRHLIAFASCFVFVSCGHADGPPMATAAVTYMIDTVSPEHREVLDLWRSYLASRPQTFTPKTQWSQAEQARYKMFDLAGGFVYGSDADWRNTRATVYQLAPAREGDSTEYVIRTVMLRPDPQLGERIINLRVYAMRENGRWVLSNAIDRMTADWKRTAFGPITYVYPPEHRLDTTRARMAVRFIDSLATAWDAPNPKAVTYYLARTPEEAFRINGIEFYLPGSRAFAIVANYMVVSGVPKYGEFYAHELTHMILGWVLPSYGTPAMLDEAMALWIGGGREMTWPEIRRELAQELRRDSTWTLEKLLEERPATFIFRLSAAAGLLDLAYQRGGMPALKASLNGSDVVGSVSTALGVSRTEVEAEWRKLILAGG